LAGYVAEPRRTPITAARIQFRTCMRLPSWEPASLARSEPDHGFDVGLPAAFQPFKPEARTLTWV